MKRAIMHIVLHTESDEEYLQFKKEMESIKQYGVIDFSLSPMRQDTMKTGYSEMYMTLQLENGPEQLLSYLADGWNGPEDDCDTNNIEFNLCHPLMTDLYFQLPDE